METTREKIGINVRLQSTFDEALSLTTEALKEQGFGILTEIDVQATLKKKLDVDYRPYHILGACNPPLAYEALGVMPEIGLLLPCNVTVVQVDDNDIEISFIDPVVMMGAAGEPSLLPTAERVKEKLLKAAAKLEEK